MENYKDMKYNDLKSLAKQRDLDASGTKEELIDRLVEADGNGAQPPAEADDKNNKNNGAENGGDDSSKEDELFVPAKEKKLAASPAKRSIDGIHRNRALRMKAKLDSQEKVRLLIPFNSGEQPEQAKKVPFHVNINGYSFDIPRGVMVEVPKQVAQMVFERLESEGRIGSEFRIDSDAKRQEALS